MVRQTDDLRRNAAFPAHTHCGDAAFTEGRKHARQPDITQPRSQRQAVDTRHFQQFGVCVGNAAQHPRIDNRQHMGKADNNRQVCTAHPEQRQNDKARHRHGADELHNRVNKNPHPAPARPRRTQQQAPCYRQQEARQYAQCAEHNALPERCCGYQLCQRPQRLQGRGQKQAAVPQPHSRQLPNHKPRGQRCSSLPQRSRHFSLHSRSRPQAGCRPHWWGQRRTGH